MALLKEVLYRLVVMRLHWCDTSWKVLIIRMKLTKKIETHNKLDSNHCVQCLLFIKPATTSPLIKLGGTPGPGTVSCPV